MRDNGPVTGIERQVPAGAFLVSRTTPEGVITFANDAFVAISGFTREELIGKPHNLVRHPDMPPAAFADLWANLQAGRCWVGTVKNRCKDGGHYWVRAAVAPVVRDGRIQSFVSVRLRPSEAEVATAEAAYRRIRDGSSGHALHRGRIRSRSPGGRLAASWQRLTTRAAWFAGPAAVLGVTGTMYAANAATGPAIGCWIAALILGTAAFAVGALGLRSRAAGLRRDLDALAAGHDVALDLDRSDELQDLVLAIASLQTHLKAATLDLGESHRSLIASFDVQIGSVLKDLSGAIGGLGETARRQTGLSEEVSACARSLASASTEMSSSIAEISAQTANADRLSTEAQQQMNAGREASQRLGQTAVEIEDVAKAIAAIAGQTNLLALNATIEAASAGEAGRGFAVVAGEVKTLARRAHEATLDISKRITAVQQDSSAVEQAMAGIAGSIQRLAQATSSIAAAIEEQTAVTHELSTSSTHVADSAREAGTAATEVDSVAVRIGAVNTSIEKAVQVFRTGG